MNKVAVFLSSGQIGGAERSIIEQMFLLVNQKEILFFVPEFSGSKKEKMDNFLKEKGFKASIHYHYPSFFYKISRKRILDLFSLLKLPSMLFYIPYFYSKFSSFNVFYINGNKAALPFFLISPFLRKGGVKVYWHFRDYPHPHFFKVFSSWFMLIKRLNPKLKFKIIGNSDSVSSDLRRYFPKEEVTSIYNLPGTLTFQKKQSVEHIGVVSMMAPWKGLHMVLLGLALYKKELQQLGIKKITFFGDNIYLTDGPHAEYKKQLQDTCQKLRIADFIDWAGIKKPEEIFSTIDLLIHPSIKPEPFGRVIAEAQKAGVVVVSTGLGGAYELIADGAGAQFLAYDYQGLYTIIKDLIEDISLRNQITQLSYSKIQRIEKAVANQVLQLF